MSGAGVIYEQMGWSPERRAAVRQRCPDCRARAGVHCDRPGRGRRRPIRTLHASRYALAIPCEAHLEPVDPVEPMEEPEEDVTWLPMIIGAGVPCPKSVLLDGTPLGVCEARLASVAELVGRQLADVRSSA